MKIQIMSDVHCEFHADEGRGFIQSLDPVGVDVLVLAGDIATSDLMVPCLKSLCERYDQATVLWVHGNHEYYMSDREAVMGTTQACLSMNRNLILLDDSHVEVGGQRFIGSTLWYRRPADPTLERRFSDFKAISGLKSWVYDKNAASMRFLEDNVRSDDIVITHHMPSMRSVSPRFVGSEGNVFFVCDMEDLIVSMGPSVWIHGHTHDVFDYEIQCAGGRTTRVVCNPVGYPHECNLDFKKDLIIEV